MYHYAYDGVMSLPSGFYGGKFLEKSTKNTLERDKSFTIYNYTAKERKSKANDTKKFQPRQKFRFLSMKRYTR